MKKIFLLIFLLFCSDLSFSENSDLRIKSEQLTKVKATIQSKEQEKNKLIIQKKTFKKELDELNRDIALTEQKLNQCIKDIAVAQKNLEKSSKLYNIAFLKSKNCDKNMQDEVDFFNKITFILPYEKNPLEYKIRRRILENKKANYEKTKRELTNFSLDLKKWQNTKDKLLNLQKQEKSLVVKHRSLIEEKNKLLDTVSGKLVVAEQEIKALNDSAKAMQDLINKISFSNKQKDVYVVDKSMLVKRKKSLPWPLNGKIIVNFGKSRHPQLDTYVISNGIKIKTTNFNKVKSISSGRVVFVGNFRSYGKVVIIDHKSSLFSIYGLLENIYVKEDQKVSKGEVLASVGSGKNNVLYFEIRKNNVSENPILWLK
ncbi:MAG: peptidoglycan DD-metalloendopeptidase family protein [Endomicrobium sp.]|jgi:septal ring factor EnvC (AmiA/AmiB activator)|uniref:murein hydrolase activator EnvC family protein n=1 Tax=Candidatus Endomicrobiellum cubanum TaxID=3242325 RepID=UPI002830E12B|nr:peptidoglycan DD-metalloendopeptidase family protein [Endomicrobium sp.]MDR2395278.1 peptidoglycan DD-metalloendopeptidase family protein [Endomicrobium sp.]